MNINLRTQQLLLLQNSPPRDHHNNHLIHSSSSPLAAAATSTSLPPPPPLPPPSQEHHPSSTQYSNPFAPMMEHQRNGIYDASPHQVPDGYQLRPEIFTGPQLPPLSSILEVPRSRMSSRAPYTDRSPTISRLSPPYPQQVPVHNIRDWKSWEVVYSPHRPSPPTSFPNNYDYRVSHTPTTDTSQPPPRMEQPYEGYFPTVPRDVPLSFRQPPDENRTLPPHPQTPESGSLPESAHAKDGWGPKIWTGTQFLPRFIKQAVVPGEGDCFHYDDGTHCKTHIDGEAVNAHWGVTKAGKPRKRLAIACITCREKKIKCDPDYPRCTQCEKFGRVCKFKNAPRGGQGSPEVTPELEEMSLHPGPQHSIVGPIEEKKRLESQKYSVHSNRHSPADFDENPLKRAKIYHPAPILNGNGNGHQTISTSPRESPPSISRRELDLLVLQSSTNPLDADEDLVMELMRVYFLHNGASDIFCLFPEKAFMLWFTNRCVPKSPDDLMLIYTLLAMATIFSSNPLHKERGKEFAAVGRYACDQRQYSLQLVQSRLLLALHYFANNNLDDAWDFCGAALRAAIWRKLDLELDKTDIDGSSEHPYNLHRDGYVECRRRTFWACFVLDKLDTLPNRHLSIISSEDVFLRLPCDAKSFEAQIEVNNPYFEPLSPIDDHITTVGPLAYLINICSIWRDVMANINRQLQRDDSDEDPRRMLSFYSASTGRLQDWRSSLPDWLSYKPANLAMASANGRIGSFITLHSLYHSAQMGLNRHLRPSAISQDQLEHSIRVANEHAEALLLMADHLAARPRIPSNGGSGESVVPFSAPFIGYAIISAVDIVTAKGYLSSLPSIPSKINGAMAVITELCTYWEGAKQQRELISQRKLDLLNRPSGSTLRAIGRHHGSPLGTYEMQEPMEKIFGRGNDCFYAVSLEVWDRALAKGVD